MSGLELLQWLVRGAFVALALVALRTWLRSRSRAAAWMTLTFASLGVAVVAGLLLPDEPEGFLELAAQRLLVAVLLLFPYLLFRFSATFEAPGRAAEAVAGAFTAVALGATFALPDFPGEGDPRPAWFVAYLAFILTSWSIVSGFVALRLWFASRAEPRLARQRIRLLAIAAIAMALALVVAGTAGGGDNEGVAFGTQLAALTSAVLFYIGFAPPRALRAWWRRAAEHTRRTTELALIAAETPDEVSELLLPRVAELVGARQVELVDGGPEPAEERSGGTGHQIEVPVHDRTLRVWTSPYAPLFGDDELALLGSLAVVADLALQRTRLLENERRISQDLQRSNAELEQFAYVASHDLKEPLQVISGFADVLADRYRGRLDDAADQYLAVIRDAAGRMRTLIDDLLALSRIGQSSDEPVPVPLDEPVGRALANLERSIEESSATVSVAGPLPVVTADARLLVQLFQNLVGNALKYSGDGVPAVEIDAEPVEDDVCLVRVADHGEGIDAAYHQKIFEPFRRLHGEEGPEGSGVGLAIVKKIVDLHGGEIWVESEAGQGATFCFTLPSSP